MLRRGCRKGETTGRERKVRVWEGMRTKQNGTKQEWDGAETKDKREKKKKKEPKKNMVETKNEKEGKEEPRKTRKGKGMN